MGTPTSLHNWKIIQKNGYVIKVLMSLSCTMEINNLVKSTSYPATRGATTSALSQISILSTTWGTGGGEIIDRT